MARPGYSVVVPTVGRPALDRVLEPLLDATEDAPEAVVVVDDRPPGAAAGAAVTARPGVRVLRSGGRGPAAARDVGWRAVGSEWVVFLDDDVVPPADWTVRLAADLADLPDHVAGSQGTIEVPPPEGRRPTDAEHATLGLAGAAWITADMAYRRSVLALVGGFDRRFRRAYREDTDIALRVLDAGYGLVRGERVTVHPLRDPGPLHSLRSQAGNADDVLMRRLHGPHWRERVGEPRGRFRRHALTTAALAGAAAAAARAAAGRSGWGPAAALGGLWSALTAEFAWHRVARGPRTPGETAAMAATSALIPPLACYHRAAGEWRHRGARPHRDRPVKAVLFDRDGTLVHDVPYNGDPSEVRPVAGARAALDLVRAAGLPLGVVSNQSGIARGLITRDQVDAVNARVEELLGPFDTWRVCAHGDADGCACRKPRPGLILDAAADLGVAPEECVVIGDIGADVDAARAAGARSVLVPTPRTRPQETAAAPATAPDLRTAVRRALRGAAA
ncbi:HAD-IIIA family hydrolase [Nocardiopsis trehalosi]|uniref:HAD-IIIA family hydrolase n=1 Tax=Nocardiopsis trehalosi TaxID=109329 RepID=UPI0008350058|nr:HAD-IIIA family hydrolase [Nocardiopsis trehalosi]